MAIPDDGMEDQTEVYHNFTRLLQDTASLTLPDETLFGAITHFLSTIPLPDLEEFVKLIINSPSLWSRPGSPKGVEEAVRVAVHAKVDAVVKASVNAYFPEYRRNKQARRWMEVIGRVVVEVESSVGRRAVLMGLVTGMAETQSVDWGSIREFVEEELVVEAADADIAEGEGLEVTCCALMHTSKIRLNALDLEDLLAGLQLRATRHSESRGDDPKQLPHASGRSYVAMNEGDEAARTAAWAAMRSFCVDARPANDDRASAARAVFLGTACSITDILVSSPPPSSPSSSRDTLHPSADIATEILHCLLAFAKAQTPLGDDEQAYHHVLYGCLDVLEAKGGPLAVAELLRSLHQQCGGRPGPDQAALILHVGEQLINTSDAGTVRSILLPLCQEHIKRTDPRETFEAAHAFIIALIQAFTGTPDTTPSQIPFMKELVPFYARLLLRQCVREDITADQSRTAYPIVVGGAARCCDDTVNSCVQLSKDQHLQTSEDPAKTQTLRSARIAIAPHVCLSGLAAYSDDLAWCILETQVDTEQRNELVEASFGMVIKGLPDAARRDGMEWWLKWRDAFEGKAEQGIDRAKL